MSSKSEATASLHRGAILHWAGWMMLLFAVAMPLVSFSEASLELAAVLGMFLLPTAVLLSAGVSLGEGFPTRHWSRCEITDDGRRLRVVQLRGSRRYGNGSLATGSLVGGLVLPKHGHWPAMVELESKHGSKLRIIDAKDGADAQWNNSWLSRYRLDAAHAPIRASLGSPLPWVLWAGGVANLLVFTSLAWVHGMAADMAQPWLVAVPWTVVVAVCAVVVARLLAPRLVIVGSDGVAIRHAFRRSFVPHADIEEVEFLGRAALRIRVCGERSVRAGWLLGVARRDALHALLQAWHQRGEAPSPKLEVLRRAGRPVRDWIGALASLSTAVDRRGDAPTPEQLLVAIDNPAAPVELRIGAIVALSKPDKLGPAAIERLHAAAATSASARIAKVLNELATGVIDAQTIEAALREGAAVQSGVHTARRNLQSEPSPAAQRDAAPEGTQVVKTHFDTFMLAIIGLPIAPIAISGFPAVVDGDTGSQLGFALSVAWLLYLVAWIVSRARSERRFVFHADRVWLPGFYHRIRGRYLAYQDIAQLGGDSEHFRIMLRNGKTRTYEGNVVDFRELEEMFRRYGVANER